jgi:hypothetical protein
LNARLSDFDMVEKMARNLSAVPTAPAALLEWASGMTLFHLRGQNSPRVAAEQRQVLADGAGSRGHFVALLMSLW